MRQKKNWRPFLAGIGVGVLLTALAAAGLWAAGGKPDSAGGPAAETDQGTAGKEAPAEEAKQGTAGIEAPADDGGREAGKEEDRGGIRAGEEYRLWEAESVYNGGDEVRFEDGIYRARWWTQNEVPERSGSGVWEYLGELPREDDPAQPDRDKDGAAGRKEQGSSGSPAEGLKIVAYYPSWEEGEENLSKLRFDCITHVNYAFAIPTEAGALRPLENAAQAEEIVRRAHAAGAKALVAVGGWSYQDVPLEATFAAATQTEEKRRKLAEEILQLCNTYGFDGVDMDWEHPRVDGASGRQYEAFMLYLAEKLHAEGKLLTAAVLPGLTPDGLVYYDAAAHTDAVLEAVDWINVMAYDGGDGDRHSTYDFAVDCAAYWKKTRKMPGEKIILGVPFYARPSWADYQDILAADPDAWKKDVSSYNGMEAWYNGCETIKKKAAYAKEQLGGIMIWEITQDTSDRSKSLLSAVMDGLSL